MLFSVRCVEGCVMIRMMSGIKGWRCVVHKGDLGLLQTIHMWCMCFICWGGIFVLVTCSCYGKTILLLVGWFFIIM